MSSNKIEISVKDIPEIIKTLEEAEKEIEFERKSKNLFIDDLYKVCEMSLKLQNQLQQKENIIKEVREKLQMRIKGFNETIDMLRTSSVKSKRYEIAELRYRIGEQEELLEILDKAN